MIQGFFKDGKLETEQISQCFSSVAFPGKSQLIGRVEERFLFSELQRFKNIPLQFTVVRLLCKFHLSVSDLPLLIDFCLFF